MQLGGRTARLALLGATSSREVDELIRTNLTGMKRFAPEAMMREGMDDVHAANY